MLQTQVYGKPINQVKTDNTYNHIVANYYCDNFSYSLIFCNGVIKFTRDIVKDVYYTRFMLITDTLVGKLQLFVHD